MTTSTTLTRRVLLCDDDIHILRAADVKLKNNGFETQLAHDGVEAWEILESGLPFDLLITDWQMPRMNGEQLITKIRSSDNEHLAIMPIVLLTSRAHDLGDCRPDQIIDKPFSPRNLVKQIIALCEAVEARREPATLP